MRKNMPYNTPEGYFDSLEARLQEIPQGSRKKGAFSRFSPYLALAASFAIAFVIGNTVLNKTAIPSSQRASEEEIVAYFIDSDISLQQIEEYLSYNE